jgi:pyridoxal phosphate enzyme (YggS family)
MSFGNIKDNYSSLKKDIKEICDSCGRNIDEIMLIAVSKTFPDKDISELYDLGHRDFGENKVQELCDKEEVLREKEIYWHLIGHLQTNKVKFIINFVSLIHSVDSLKLAREIQKRAAQSSKLIDILIQVNTSGEDSKYGIEPDKAKQLYSEIKDFDNVRIRGLMTIGKFTENEDEIRMNFSKLRSLYDELKDTSKDFKYLSMGMTSDYRIAIEEGSNMLRIGSAIFGDREYGKI